MASDPKIPGQCPVCGAYSLAPERPVSTLLTVSDVLVYKALESMGKSILRSPRGRFQQFGSRPFHEAHTFWPANDALVDKVLRRAWDVVPALLDTHGCCGVTSLQVTRMLDDYVHDLAITGTPHSIEELSYRYSTRLGLPVYDHRPEDERHSHLSHHAVTDGQRRSGETSDATPHSHTTV